MKLAVFSPIPTPYRDLFWNHVAGLPTVELSVFYLAAGKGDRPWAGDWSRHYHWQVLPGRNLLQGRGEDASLYHNPGLVSVLQEGGFDAVLVGGYNHLTLLSVMRWCRRHAKPYFLMCESHLQAPRSRWRQALKRNLVEWVVKHMAGGLPTGKWAEQYLLHYGAKPSSLHRLPNVPDMRGIHNEVAQLREDLATLKAELGLDERPTLLFVGRLIPKKGAHIVLQSLAELMPEQRPLVVLVGEGEQGAALHSQVSEMGLQKDVHFAGFVQPAELPRWYAAADGFVLPSQETWGVVVLEALAAGLQCLVSDQVGCHPDVITGPEFGQVLPREDISAWTAAVGSLASAARPRKPEGLHPHLEVFSYQHQAGTLVAAVQARLGS